MVIVVGVDPDQVVVAVFVLRVLDLAERRAAVVGHLEEDVDLVHPLGIAGGGEELLVVVRAGPAGQVGVAPLPGPAPVGRSIEAPLVLLGCLDRGVDQVGIGRCHRQTDSSHLALRESPVDALPGRAGVVRDVDSRAGAAPEEGPHPATALVGGRHDGVGIVGGEDGAGHTGVVVYVEDPLPGVPTVNRLVQTAFTAGRPQRALGGHVDDLAVSRVDQDVADVLGPLEADAAPRVATVVGPVHPVTPAHVAAADCFAGTDPNDPGARGVDAHAPDRIRGLLVEDRCPRDPGVLGAPDPTRPDADEPPVRFRRVDGQIGDASAHECGADATHRERGQGARHPIPGLVVVLQPVVAHRANLCDRR